MAEKHFGFRVSGITPSAPYTRASDLFALRLAAIECAQRLDAAGWTQVTCAAVGEDEDGPTRYEIEFKAIA